MANKSKISSLSEEMSLVDEALHQHRNGEDVSARHPKTGEVMEVIDNPELGVLIVSTPQLGQFYRVKYSPISDDAAG